MEHQRKVPGGDTSPSLGPIPMKAIQKTGEVVICTNVDPIIAHHVGNDRSIALNGTGLQISFFEKVKKKLCDLVYRGRPEVHLV